MTPDSIGSRTEQAEYRKNEGRRLIEDVVRFINVQDRASDNIWSVLTALRGPDSGNEELKKVTTSRIRGRVGLKGYTFLVNTDGQPILESRFDAVSIVKDPKDMQPHFLDHVSSAVRALIYFGFRS